MCDPQPVSQHAFDEVLEQYRWRFGVEDPTVLDWTGTMRVRTRTTDAPTRDERPDAPARGTVIFGPAGAGRLAHPDAGVHLVVLDARTSAPRTAEARRVARDGVLVWAPDGDVTAHWLRPPPEMGSPRVTVLVRSSGDDEALRGCLMALAAATAAVDAVEVLVAGPSPSATTAAAVWPASAAPLRFVTTDPVQGPVAALDVGAADARGAVLALVGEDVRVQQGWLRPLVRPLMRADDTGTVTGTAGTDAAPDALLAVRPALLWRLGAPDPRLGDDAVPDFLRRVRTAGRRTVDAPQSVATLAS